MTFTNTIIARGVMGDLRYVIGSTANDSTSGEVVTGLSRVSAFIPVVLDSSVGEIAVDETFPLSSGSVTVVTESSKSFVWIAIESK